jgi:ATP-dependent Clp protease ATP-binding subunit ClpC
MIGNIEFSPRLRRVLAAARAEGIALNHEYIGTEHLLLALVSQADGAAGDVVRHLDVSADQIRQKVEEVVPAWRDDPANSQRAYGRRPDAPYTERSKRVLELTILEALRAQVAIPDTEHLLLGLCEEGQGIGAQLLKWAGLTTDVARERLQEISGRATTSPDAPASE